MAQTSQSGTELSHDTKTIITVVCLLTVYPVGVILMFIWMDNWPTWVKVLILIPSILAALIFIFALITILTVAAHESTNMTSMFLNLLGA